MSLHLRKKTGDAALDTLFVRGRHFQISAWVSTQKLRLDSNAVRVNALFFIVWRLRNQLEKDSLLEELTALLPKRDLKAIYEEAVSEPYSFLYIYLLNHRDAMFHVMFERMFQMQAADGNCDGDGLSKLLGSSSTLCQSECRNINCCTSTAARVYDQSKPPWMQQPTATADAMGSTDISGLCGDGHEPARPSRADLW